jgi:diaminobutyrate-2-oxoglutarate transaminase
MTAVTDPRTAEESGAEESAADVGLGVRSGREQAPVVFTRARGAELCTQDGRRFVDLLAGEGDLNYGHNNAVVRRRLLDYLAADGVAHGLDTDTAARREFLRTFDDVVLRPRDLDFTVRFCGPTGTDAVEAALALTREATGRRGVVAFTGSPHGGPGRGDVTVVPYPGPLDSVAEVERVIAEAAAGVPAAIIVEPMQLDGGVRQAPPQWLRRLRAVADRHGVLLVADETRTGGGRTGTFFCFEQSGVRPDVVTTSTSVGGYGLSLSMVLLRRDLDARSPSGHVGTRRGSQLAFVAATAACELWTDAKFRIDVGIASRRLDRFRAGLAGLDPDVDVRGRGMVLGIDLARAGGPDRAERLRRYAFDHDVVVGLCGGHDEVVELTPPLAIDITRLDLGLDVVRRGLSAA